MSRDEFLADEARRAVRKAVDLLDEKGPRDWRAKIDTRTLDVSDSDNCVLWQVYGSYFEGLEILGIDAKKVDAADLDDLEWAFSGPECTPVWINEIEGSRVPV